MAERPIFPSLIQIARVYWRDPEQFRTRYPHPWLLWTVSSPGGTELSGVPTAPLGKSGRIARVGDPLLFPVTKRLPNPTDLRVTLGRAETNDIVVSDEEVSRLHAVLVEVGGIWTLMDCHSKNGTWLDGAPISAHQPAPLGEEAKVSIGGLEMRFFTAHRLAEFLAREEPEPDPS